MKERERGGLAVNEDNKKTTGEVEVLVGNYEDERRKDFLPEQTTLSLRKKSSAFLHGLAYV